MLDLTPITTAVTALQQHEKDALARDQAIQAQVSTLTKQLADLQASIGTEPDTAPLLAQLADAQATADQIGQAVGTGDATPPAAPNA